MFESGEWLGTGQVSFTFSSDVLHYRTKWSTFEDEGQDWHCLQRVEIAGGDQLLNQFTISKKDDKHFGIVLSNDQLGTFNGVGIIDDKTIAWEFRKPSVFEGYEVYERLHNKEYTMHAEYLAHDGARTIIRGRIWKKEE